MNFQKTGEGKCHFNKKKEDNIKTTTNFQLLPLYYTTILKIIADVAIARYCNSIINEVYKIVYSMNYKRKFYFTILQNPFKEPHVTPMTFTSIHK